MCVVFRGVCKSLRSAFCGQTEGSGKVDHIQYLMAHYLFMSPTTHGPLGKEGSVCECECVRVVSTQVQCDQKILCKNFLFISKLNLL